MIAIRSVGPADSYIKFYEALSHESIDKIVDVATPDIHFCDPFSDVTGIEAYKNILVRMLKTMPDAKFKISHQAVDGDTCFLRWRMDATFRGAQWVIQGMSELKFAPDGKVCEHIDHWDAGSQFYERLPLLGVILRFLKRRVSGAH
ncbi:MAG TPA: nuclear transport factor 2 family protein [Rhodospirillaceae bacterium]|nr:hypothetical protein [Candidatus Neomarinimicrobiota bacterium]HCX14952.1 nuclear transport factor 2 family protein [Rhodospirillaceae bacterium]